MVRLYITAIFNAVAMARLYATVIFNAVAIAATVANRHHQPPAVRTGGPLFFVHPYQSAHPSDVIQTPDISNAREVALDLVRSMAHFVYGFYDKSFSQLHTLSRPEELAGQFLALVERHCHEQHAIDWYATEMCLTPKYIANVVKQVTGWSAGECIAYNLIRQAKSLLLTTTLPVQQIADRLGFHNQSHFGTFFRREVGVSPKAFREKRG